MPNQSSQSGAGAGRFWGRLVLVIVLAAGLAGVINYTVMPWIAREVFSRTPASELVSLDETREEVTREVAIAIIAGMLGPTQGDPPPDDEDEASRAERESTSDRPSGGSKRRQRKPPDRETAPAADDEAAPSEAADPSRPDEGSDDTAPSGASRDDAGEEAPPVPDEMPVYEVNRRKLNRRLQEPESVRDKVSVVSHRGADGKPRGLRVVAIGGWFGEYGLHTGDVVTAINGKKVTSRQQAVTMLMGMQKQTTFTLDVERHDKNFQIRYHMPHGNK